MKALLVIFSVLSISLTALADQLIFVVNTTETNSRGPGTAPYLDEARWAKEWDGLIAEKKAQNSNEKIKLISIRANSNKELTSMLELWMRPTSPDQAPPTVLGLAIYSHGSEMILSNESAEFKMELPTDIAAVLSPVVGRFAPGARVIMTGCNILTGQSEPTARTSLKWMADALEMKEGMIYAQYSRGLDPYTLFASPLNSDMKPGKRLAALATYMMWPFSAPMVPLISKYILNKGYILKLDKDADQLLKVHHNVVFETVP